MPRSIVGWFVLCWSAFLVVAVAVGALLVAFYAQTTSVQVQRAEAAVAHGCDAIAARAEFLLAGTQTPPDPADPRLTAGLTQAVTLALHRLSGVEGGVWSLEQGPLAYAFPTYAGTGKKTDLPEAERATIRAAADAAVLDDAASVRRYDERGTVLLLAACPLRGPEPHLAGWAMARVPTAGGDAFALATAGLGVLLAVVLGSAAWLGWKLWGWARRLRVLEQALADGGQALPVLAPTGQRDLDRIVRAVNAAGARLEEARARNEALSGEMARAERLAALGRVAGAVAHEIRNPIAAMRLKAENAAAPGADPARKDRALAAILDQVARLDRLTGDLLRSAQRTPPRAEAVPDVAAFLAQRAELFREQAAARGMDLAVAAPPGLAARFDPGRVGQAVDNLLLNAIQNGEEGGRIVVSAERTGEGLRLAVRDTGPGVPPALRAHLFEPFVTGRPDGTGLGLAIVREVAESHGGRALAEHHEDGTSVAIELPA